MDADANVNVCVYACWNDKMAFYNTHPISI